MRLQERAVYYGYLHLEKPQPAAQHAAYDALVCWCVREGRYLSTVFRDIGISTSSLQRPGLTRLLDAVTLPESAGVIVLNWTHLSRSAPVAKRLTLAIQRTGTELLVVEEILPKHPATEHPPP